MCLKFRKNILVGSSYKCVTVKRVRNKVVYDTKRWYRLRDYVRSKYYVCARCGSIESLQLHHIVKVDDDITKAYDIDNVVLLCPSCYTFVDRNCMSGTLDFEFQRYEYEYDL